MANVNDVAAYILQQLSPISAMKLQKLAYYAQAWHLVWEERPLFSARIEAWANGPVVYELYQQHRGRFTVDSWAGDPASLDCDEMSTVDVIVEAYGEFTAHQLSEMTHRESPWVDARAGVADGARSNQEITTASMHEYYHGLSHRDG
ncbi:MAG: Panacea domain-containing protein [Pseudoclavibacter sp.]